MSSVYSTFAVMKAKWNKQSFHDTKIIDGSIGVLHIHMGCCYIYTWGADWKIPIMVSVFALKNYILVFKQTIQEYS